MSVARSKKKLKKQQNEEGREEVQIIDDEEMEEVGSKKKPRFLGPIDKFASTIYPDSSMDTNIIDAKAKDRLDRPLHLAAYLLNPYYFFKDQSIEDDPMVMDAFITCVEMFFPDDFQLQHLVSNVELLKYKGKVGLFGRALAMVGCACNDDNYDPEVEPGSGLTWGMIGEASGAVSAVEPRRSYRNVEVRELHEEDFLSDQETEEDGDEEYDFESDKERVLEGYGEEELET
ncbi:hypothetical protein Acr_00g0029840 [Actinidia rufa]|uniref:Uncharacterized protein n=1 Tax=Actinidia rufa TaxID=165716 RepID=A0A7J0DEQ7_9ERIC|nr:hypothetical protein Acr_00g0029840 [Actinidia rufa]